jgi:hypothetical protein
MKWGMSLAMMLAAVFCSAESEVVKINSSDCEPASDCFSTIASAIEQCKQAHGQACTIELAQGQVFPFKCPVGARPSVVQTEHPAVDLSSTNSLVFGGGSPLDVPTLLIDYVNGGCAAIAAHGAANLTVQHLTIDNKRLPSTVGTVLAKSDPAGDGRSITIKLEAQEPGVYRWDEKRYPWLNYTETFQKVVPGARATRDLPHINAANYTAHANISGGEVEFIFPGADATRAQLRSGDRVFLKHFGNKRAWGVYGWNVSGWHLNDVTLLSCAGMGFRCDFCSGVASIRGSRVQIKPGTRRPMSITADATHFMHHKGRIELFDSSFEGQGDDGFNCHGNFIIVSQFISARTVAYIDESGPGWIKASPSYMVGDRVSFYSRGGLVKLQETTIVAADERSATFADDISPHVSPWDMFISTTRTTSLEARGCFFGNSNSRGMVVSARPVVITNTTFANSIDSGLIFLEGGCGGGAGDYTEGPFAGDITISNNTFSNVATHLPRPNYDINNRGMLQFSGAVPLSPVCGWSGSNDVDNSRDTGTIHDPAGQQLSMLPFTLAGPAAAHAFEYYQLQDGTGEVEIALYSSTMSAKGLSVPKDRLATVTFPVQQAGKGWRSQALVNLTLGAGDYVLVHRSTAPWTTAFVPGIHLAATLLADQSVLPTSFNTSSYTFTKKWSSGLPLRVRWSPLSSRARQSEGQAANWCAINATQAPTIRSDGHDGLNVQSDGRYLTRGQIYSNVTITNNVFTQETQDWHSFIAHIGAVKGLVMHGNLAQTHEPTTNLTFLLYNNEDVSASGNRCLKRGREVACGGLPAPR